MESLLPEYERLRRGARARRQRAARHRADQRLPLQRRLRAGRRQRRQHLPAPDAGDRPPRPRRRPGAGHNDGRVRASTRSTPRSAPGRSSAAVDDVLAALDDAGVPAGRIYTVADIASDPHYRARDMIHRGADLPTARRSRCRASCPSSARTPGAVAHAAPRLGEHTDQVLDSLGIDIDRRR